MFDAPVEERWPAVAAWLACAPLARSELRADTPWRVLSIEGVQLESAYDPRSEAVLQSALVPAGAKTATLYGLAQGTLARTLLRRPALERLRVVILNPSAARESLRCFDHADWLRDPRVELVRAADCQELEVPFAAAPASLRLASDDGARLRDLVRLELATPHVRRHLRKQSAQFAERIRANHELLEHDGDVTELFGIWGRGTVRVAGAGPSLSDHFERLRDGADANRPLVAVDAALGPLVAAGIVPDVVVTVDAHEEGPRRLLELDEPELAEAVLVYFPTVVRSALESWPGRRLAAYPPGELYADARARHPKGELFSSGSVIHPAVDLAGADFAIPEGKSHVSGSAWEREYELGPDTPWVLDGHGRRIPSFPNLIGYLRDLERYIADHPRVTFVNAGREGAAIAGARAAEDSHAA